MTNNDDNEHDSDDDDQELSFGRMSAEYFKFSESSDSLNGPVLFDELPLL